MGSDLNNNFAFIYMSIINLVAFKMRFPNKYMLMNLSQIKIRFLFFCIHNLILSYDVASGSEITPCNKIDKPLVVYKFTGNVMTSTTTMRT